MTPEEQAQFAKATDAKLTRFTEQMVTGLNDIHTRHMNALLNALTARTSEIATQAKHQLATAGDPRPVLIWPIGSVKRWNGDSSHVGALVTSFRQLCWIVHMPVLRIKIAPAYSPDSKRLTFPTKDRPSSSHGVMSLLWVPPAGMTFFLLIAPDKLVFPVLVNNQTGYPYTPPMSNVYQAGQMCTGSHDEWPMSLAGVQQMVEHVENSKWNGEIFPASIKAVDTVFSWDATYLDPIPVDTSIAISCCIHLTNRFTNEIPFDQILRHQREGGGTGVLVL